MLIIGLTGSIGMGKTETAKMFAELGVPVFDSDAAVHALYDVGGAAVGPIGDAFPGTVVEGRVDRERLAGEVLGKPAAMARLEALIHPLVRQTQRDWLQAQADAKAWAVVLDVPLLFETGGEERVDVVVVVSAPEAVQRARVLERPGMTEEKLDKILAKQTPDAEKRARADFVIPTDQGLDAAFAEVEKVLAQLRSYTGRIWTGMA
jgi:dephospho-CoA kinase